VPPTLLENVRLTDAAGDTGGAWIRLDGATITARGLGDPGPGDAGEERRDLGGARVVPGFLDLHVHGGGGAAADDGPAGMRTALQAHRAHGTTRSLLSLVTAPLEELTARLREIRELTAEDPRVLGAHLEGPFLAPERRGAHDAALLRAPDAASVAALLEAADGTLRQVTLAPELPGAEEAIDALVAAGVVVAIGHTEADHRVTRSAIDRGARLVTHAFNAMRQIGHREPGPLPAAFDDDRVVLELIADGIHVHPEVLALAFRAAPGRIALVTDAMAAAGAPEGAYRIGELDVTVADGRAVLTGTETLAGSTLTLDAAVRTVLAAGVGASEAVAAATATPARVLGLDDRLGLLAPGYAADLVVLDAEWRVREVWSDGAPLS